MALSESTASSSSPPIWFANAFIVAYGADAVLSLVSLASDLFIELPPLIALQRYVAVLVLLGAILCVPILAICARLPMGMLLTLCASVLWLAGGGAPLALAFDLEWELPAALGAIQLGLAAATLLRIRHLNRGENWLLTDSTRGGPQIALGHSLRSFAAMLFVMVPLLVGYVVVSFATWLEVGTESFVQVNLSGIQLADRRYAQGENEVRLVGMMHVGEDESYRALTASFVSENTIVLEEGVSDEGAVLEGALTYERLARNLGLQTQQPIGFYLFPDGVTGAAGEWPVLRNADVDARVFAPETVEYLALAAGIWDTDEPLLAFIDFYRHVLEHPELAEVFLRDILELRNRHLLAQIQIALPQYKNVIVPWGALHLPEIERKLLEQGFVFEDETRRQVVGWSTLLAALL